MGQGSRLAGTLAGLDVEVWSLKTVREAHSIAARVAPPGRRATVDPARVAAVLAAMVERLEAERQALAGRGDPAMAATY